MINKVTLNGVAVPGIIRDTFHYNGQCGSAGAFRFGSVSAEYIEFDYFTPSAVTISMGDVLEYFWTVDVDVDFNPTTPTDLSMGKYTVVEVVASRKRTHIVAYGYTLNLKKDFSARLKSLENSFPLRITDILNEIATVSGLQWIKVYPLPSFFSKKINYFYVDGITCREVLSYIAELFGSVCNVYTRTLDGAGCFEIQWGYGSGGDRYIIAPDDSDYSYIDPNQPHYPIFGVNVWYKENGLEKKPVPTPYDGVKIISSNGAVLGKYDSVATPSNYYYVAGNLIADNFYNFSSSDYDGIASNIYTCLGDFVSTNISQNSYSIVPTKVRLFPFRSFYQCQGRAFVVDTDGNITAFYIMNLDITEDAALLECYGNVESETGYNTSYGTVDEQQTLLTSQINAIFTALDNLQPKKDVLWTNTAPTSSFGAQQVPLDESASDYDFLMFVYYWDTGNNDISTKTFPVSMLSSAGGMLDIVRLNQNRTGGRTFTLDSDTEVTFSGAQFNGTSNNSYAIPAEIIGIKL